MSMTETEQFYDLETGFGSDSPTLFKKTSQITKIKHKIKKWVSTEPGNPGDPPSSTITDYLNDDDDSVYNKKPPRCNLV